MTNTEIVLEIESRQKEREWREINNSLNILPTKTRKQLIRIATKIKFMFDSKEESIAIQLKVFRACADSSVTLDTMELVINKTGQSYSKKGASIDKMLKEICKEADKINKPKKPSLIKRLFNG